MPNCNFSFKTKARRFQASKANNSLSYTITSIDSKSYLGIIGFKALDSAHTGVYLKKEKVLKANTKRELNYHKEQQKPIVGDLSLFTFLARDLSKPRERPIGNKANSLEW
ncbi:uncharacterized protein LY79DRAFT_585460 [Colletotrichum navitas]|uniref:Uncharacterized protein n=1 Tax=Colletotrichum navitas TaxID=681940 RepID=A0AAD8UXR1_9PEZI|nr:uncharacterized protein LY79DRAFT_585460 [Colletotrichum navitas]KAK1561619.1 hypothetical protein LY79DRAFT_585460 [Colletotrichum navitas]